MSVVRLLAGVLGVIFLISALSSFFNDTTDPLSTRIVFDALILVFGVLAQLRRTGKADMGTSLGARLVFVVKRGASGTVFLLRIQSQRRRCREVEEPFLDSAIAPPVIWGSASNQARQTGQYVNVGKTGS